MAKDPLLPDAPGDGDSWESLASNLLGIDLNQSIDAGIVSPEELDELESELDEAVPQFSSEHSAGDAESKKDPESQASPAPVSDFSAEASAESDASHTETAASSARDTDPKKPQPESDPYWDPLAAWEWDNDAPTAKPAAEVRPSPAEAAPAERKVSATERSATERSATEKSATEESADSVVKGPGTDARRAADSFDTVSDYRDEYQKEDDWEFGAGLIEGVDAPQPKAEKKPKQRSKPDEGRTPPKAVPADSDTASDSDEKRREEQRRPRRERDESRSRAPVEPSKVKEQPPKKEASAKTVPDNSFDEDSFGAGLEDPETTQPAEDIVSETTNEEPKRERRPRRRRRGRAQPREDSAREDSAREDSPRDDQSSEAAESVVISETEEFDEDQGRFSESSESEAPYRNIPSWEETISYLVKPLNKAASSEESPSRESRSSGSKSDSGRRRRRRRPSK